MSFVATRIWWYDTDMVVTTWVIEHWREVIENSGIIGGLVFTGLALRIDARVRRAGTIIDISKQHREIWMYFYERPQLGQLFSRDRDLRAHPLADEEVHFVNFLINHLRATFYARSAGIFVQPECLRDDIRGFLSYPAPRSAWERLKHSHDYAFVAFVERNLENTEAE